MGGPLLLLAGLGAGLLRGTAKGKLVKRERKLEALEELSDLAGTLESTDVNTFRRRGRSIAQSYGMDPDEATGMIEPFISGSPDLGETLTGGKAVKRTKLEELSSTIDELQKRTGREFTGEEETELLIRGLGLEAKAAKLPTKRTKTIKKDGKLFKQDVLVTPEGEKPYGEPYPLRAEPRGKAPENAWMNKLMEQMPAELAAPEEKKAAWDFFYANRQSLKNQGYDTDYMETQLIAAYGAREPVMPPVELPAERIKELSEIFPQSKYRAVPPFVPEDIEDKTRPPFIPERGAQIIPPFTEKPEDEEDIKARFRQDPSMQGYKLGKKTAFGYEVYDRKGNLVGHYK